MAESVAQIQRQRCTYAQSVPKLSFSSPPMSANTNHPVPTDTSDIDMLDAGQPTEWGPSNPPAAAAPSGPKVGRYLNALKRFKWLILMLTLTGAAGGYFATRLIEPEFEVQATIM